MARIVETYYLPNLDFTARPSRAGLATSTFSGISPRPAALNCGVTPSPGCGR